MSITKPSPARGQHALRRQPMESAMDKTHLLRSSILFAVLWTVGMMVWSAPLDLPTIISLVIAGAFAGLLWHWLFGRWANWYFRRTNSR